MRRISYLLRLTTAVLLLGAQCAGAVPARLYPVEPYVDPAQLDVPWPRHSFYKQPWRAWLETMPATTLLQGMGVNYNADPQEPAIRLLAENGIRCFRHEVGWSALGMDDQLQPQQKERLVRFAALCKQYGVRPIILLNAHHGAPCPSQALQRALAVPAKPGDREVTLDSTRDLEPERTMFATFVGSHTAPPLVKEIADEHRVILSKPIPEPESGDKSRFNLPAGSKVSLRVLKYAPLHPVGTPEFDATATGWQAYTRAICQAMREGGLANTEFALEMWNELSFGSAFTNANHYYDPPLPQRAPDFLNAGGTCWEMVNRDLQMLQREFPGVEVIWGFSNTTFFHTAVAKLPPGTAGQSYHPYWEGGPRVIDPAAREKHPIWYDRSLESPLPAFTLWMPEAAMTWYQCESIARLLNPEARSARPAGSPAFRHYITEYNVVPESGGVTERDAAIRMRQKMIARAFPFFMNKGLSALALFCAREKDVANWALLPPDVWTLKEYPAAPADAERAAGPLLAISRRLAEVMAGAQPAATTRAFSVEVASYENRVLLPGSANWQPGVGKAAGDAKAPAAGGSVPPAGGAAGVQTDPRFASPGAAGSARGAVPLFSPAPAPPSDKPFAPLTSRECFCVLPFQITPQRFAIGLYVMTRDLSRDYPPERYRVRIRPVAAGARVSLYDPMLGKNVPVRIRARDKDSLTVEFDAVDTPRWLKIEEDGAARRK